MSLTFTIEVPVAAVAPAFTSGPTLSGTPDNDETMTLAFEYTGTEPVTVERRRKIGADVVDGATGATWVGAGITPGDTLTGEVRLTNSAGTTGWVASNALTAVDAPPVLVAPSAFTDGQWELADSPSAGGNTLTLTISALPSDGGSAITALQYRIGGGAAATLSGTGTGARTITVLAETLASIQIRAVNVIGNGDWSTAKTATPTVSGAGTADFIVTSDAEWNAAIAAATSGDIIEIQGSSFSRLVVTGDFSPGGLTVRGAAGAEFPNGLRFQNTVSSITFRDLKMSRQIGATSGWWSPVADTLDGVITHVSGNVSNIVLENLVIDGGIDPLLSGGLNTSNTALTLREWNGGAVRNCTIQRCWAGVYFIGARDIIFENNETFSPVTDHIVLANGNNDCANIVIRNNHMVGRSSGIQYHTDMLQFQPDNGKTTKIRDIYFYGNTMSVGEGPWMAQPDRLSPVSLVIGGANTKTADFTVTQSEAFREIQVNPGGGTVTATILPASDGRYQYFIRQTGTGTINVALSGSDTWKGGAAPTLTGTGQYASFVSDGVSDFSEQRPGADYRSANVIVTSDTTVLPIWDGQIVTVDARNNDVTLTLPAGYTTSPGFVICRIDDSANAVTLVKTGADTITRHGILNSSVPIAPGYSVEARATAGVWALIEDPITSQLVFGNPHNGGGEYRNINISGNIMFGLSGSAFRVDQSSPDVSVHNNTFLPWLSDDMNGDGVISRYEGNGGSTLAIQMNGPTAKSGRNFTIGPVVLVDTGKSLDDIALNNTNNVGLEATLGAYFNGSTRAAYRPSTRGEVIAAALAKSGGALDGTFIGAAGTTASNGYYDFDAGQINPALPAPVVTEVTPAIGATAGVASDLIFAFDQYVAGGTGLVTLYNMTDAATVETFNVATGAGSAGGSVAFVGFTMAVNPAAALVNGKQYSVRVASGAVVSAFYGSAYAGVTDNTYNFTAASGTPSAYVPLTADAGAHWTRSGAWGANTAVTKFLFAAELYGVPDAAIQHRLFGADAVRDVDVSYAVANGQLRVNFGDCGFRSPSVVPVSGTTRRRILLSIDTTQATIADGVKLYVDGVLASLTNTAWTQNSSINMTSGAPLTQHLLNRGAGDMTFGGELAFIYADIPATLPDLSDSAVRAMFNPGSIGANGSGPTGAQPLIYMTGDRAAWNGATNLGSVAGFAKVGTF